MKNLSKAALRIISHIRWTVFFAYLLIAVLVNAGV